MDYKLRRHRLKQTLRRRKIDVLLVSQPNNRRYLSGFTACDHNISESSGVLFIPARGESLLLTDFRYQLQAEEESDLPVRLYSKGMFRLLKTLLTETNCRRFAFEAHYTLHATGRDYQKFGSEKQIECLPITDLVERMRVVKSEEEIALIRKSVRLNEAVFNAAYPNISADMSEIEVAVELEMAMRKGGASAPSFDTIVAAGENSARPHAIPTVSPIGSNRSVTIDMGLILSGYCSDMTRNFVIGEMDEQYQTIHRLVRKAQIQAIKTVKAGLPAAEVDRAARKIISEAGYGNYFRHSTGHGVGLAVHEEPRISQSSRKKLKAGMVLTVEPGIYVPGWGGVRLENMVVVRDDGCDVLNQDTTWLDI